MKKLALLLGCLIWLGGVAPAAEEATKPDDNSAIPLVATLRLVQMSDAQFAKIEHQKSTAQTVDGTVLMELALLTQSDRPSLIHVGDKWPIVYFDARSEQFQIQFVDMGGKLDLTLKKVNENGVNVEIRPEVSVLRSINVAGDPKRLEGYPSPTVLIFEGKVPYLEFDHTLILASTRGPSARTLLGALGRPAGNDNVVYLLKVERI